MTVWFHANILFEPLSPRMPLAPSFHAKLEAHVRENSIRCDASGHFAHPKRGCGCNPRKFSGLRPEKGAFHSSFIFEFERATPGETVHEADLMYQKLLEKLVERKCKAIGAFHPVSDEGCSCNVMDLNSVREAAERGALVARAGDANNA
jgi:hypothetical protein